VHGGERLGMDMGPVTRPGPLRSSCFPQIGKFVKFPKGQQEFMCKCKASGAHDWAIYRATTRKSQFPGAEGKTRRVLVPNSVGGAADVKLCRWTNL